jgi:hypothetical protein
MFYTRPSDQKTYCFQPVPLVAESKEFLKTDAGQELAIVHTLTFNGTLLPAMPALSGVPDESTCISLLARKRDQMCDALSEDRGDLLVVDASGYPIFASKPIVRGLDFEETKMVQRSNYTVTFEYEDVLASGFPVRSYDESWDFNQEENDTIGASHSVNAVGIEDTTLNIPPHIVAKNFVLSRLGFDASQSFALRSPIVDPLLDIAGFSAFNRIITENSDITAGSYSITESWTLSSGNFLDDRTIDQSFERDEEGNFFQTDSINGTVQGYGDTTFEKETNAINGFDTFVAPQIGFNDTVGVESKSKSTNRVAGTVTYSIVRVPDSGGQDDLINKTITRSFDRQEDGSVTQSVTAGAAVRQSSASGIQLAIDYAFANNIPIDSVEPIFDASLSGNIVSVSTQRDELQKSFSLTRTYVDQTTQNYTESYEVERTKGTDTSQISININGTVQGLGSELTTKGNARFLAASGAYFGTIEGLIPSRIASIIPTGSCVASDATTETLGWNELAGTISYAQTFETRIKTSNPKVLKEVIEINFDRPAQVIAVIPIPGKPDGPILQDQETVTGNSKQLSITYTMRQVDSCGNTVATSNQALQDALDESDILVNNTPTDNDRGEKPESSKVFKTQDTVSFNRQSYQFTRNVTWQYL